MSTIRRATQLLLLSLAAAGGGVNAAEMSFAHLAPGAGKVQLSIDGGNARTLRYRDVTSVESIADGLRQFEARREDGTLIAEGELKLSRSDRYVLMLAGNGSPSVPFQFRLSADHNHPFVANQWSRQVANLAIFANAEIVFSPPPESIVLRDDCEDPIQSIYRSEDFGFGTTTLDGSDPGSSNLQINTLAPDQVALGLGCRESLVGAGSGQVIADLDFVVRPGDRLRRFSIGDGLNEPYEMLLVHQGSEPILPSLPWSAALEGLWSVAGEPNTGLQIAYDPTAPAGQQISGVYFGHDGQGMASWRALAPAADAPGQLRIVDQRGGNPDGTRAMIGFDRGNAELLVHSCFEISLIPEGITAARSGGMLAAAPRNALRLHKLLPDNCVLPDAGGAREE